MRDEHDFRDRGDVARHLEERHRWTETRRAYVVDGPECPSPVGWIDMDGRYMIPTSELLAVHRELTDLAARARAAAS